MGANFHAFYFERVGVLFCCEEELRWAFGTATSMVLVWPLDARKQRVWRVFLKGEWSRKNPAGGLPAGFMEVVRGAGRIRTGDGGFAIRCLSHLATAPDV